MLILRAAERAFVTRSNLKSFSIEHCDAYPANEVLPVAAGGDVAPTASQAADALQHLERVLDDAEGLIQSRPAVRSHQDAPAGSHWKRPRPAPSVSPDLDMQSPLGVPPPPMPRPSAARIDSSTAEDRWLSQLRELHDKLEPPQKVVTEEDTVCMGKPHEHLRFSQVSKLPKASSITL